MIMLTCAHACMRALAPSCTHVQAGMFMGHHAAVACRRCATAMPHYEAQGGSVDSLSNEHILHIRTHARTNLPMDGIV